MIDDKILQAKNGIKRIIDLEKMRARRRTLKKLLLGAGVITAGGVANAQTNRAASVLPSINLLLGDEPEQCGVETEEPTAPTGTPAAEFVLTGNNYTGTASMQTLVSHDNLTSPICVNVTYSVCMEVVSSDQDSAVVNLDIIAITEGLSAIDAGNADPAVDYYFRGTGPRGAGDEGSRRLNGLSIQRESESSNNYFATGGPGAGSAKSCGFVVYQVDFNLSIANNQPVITFSGQTREVGAGFVEGIEVRRSTAYSLPTFQIILSEDDCSHPERVNSSCTLQPDPNPARGPGSNTLTTPPEPLGGPIL